MIAPGSILGVVGGGQLARMFCAAANRAGYRVAVLTPEDDSPAAAVAQLKVQANYDDLNAADELAKMSQAVTVEFENIPAATLERIAKKRPVQCPPNAARIAQNRLAEKKFFLANGIAATPFIAIKSPADAQNAPMNLFPGILKTAQLGYDGKGQFPVESRESLCGIARHFSQGQEFILEKRVEFEKEISVILARDNSGEMVFYPAMENRHCGGILESAAAPASINKKIEENAIESSAAIARALNYRGVLCVEFFVMKNGGILANEFAPRPHNSGHWTIDAANRSQFDLQLCCLAGLPMPPLELKSAAATVNLLGDLWKNKTPDFRPVFADPKAALHLYGKTSPHPKRKMGHITVLDSDAESARHRALSLREKI